MIDGLQAACVLKRGKVIQAILAQALCGLTPMASINCCIFATATSPR